jgi:asparagine N-glycosylation enzyme membrane subunit Stt3
MRAVVRIIFFTSLLIGGMSFLALLLFGSFKAGMVFLLVAVWLVLGISIIKENERANIQSCDESRGI